MKIPDWLKKFKGGPSRGDARLIEAVSNHVEKWLGEPLTLHEIRSEAVQVDVHCVPPSEDRPFFTLVTSGMAEKPMYAPVGAKDCTHAELVMFLPPEWELNRSETSGPMDWQIRVLKALARYPHQAGTWLWRGHTVPLGNLVPPGVGFSFATLCLPLLLAPEQTLLRMNDGRSVSFLGVALLFPEEQALALIDGGDYLLDVAEEKDLVEDLLIVNPERASLVK